MTRGGFFIGGVWWLMWAENLMSAFAIKADIGNTYFSSTKHVK